MPTKDTQKLILDTAVELFNAHGSARISANKIADTCNLSHGHLYYHFKKKDEIIHAIYDRMVAEARRDWSGDLETPTAAHLLEMFDRHLALVWRYRFFYREMTALLAADEHLNQGFARDRQARTGQIVRFFQALIDARVMVGPQDPKVLDNLVKASWIVCDNWINYVTVDGTAAYPDCVAEGYQLVLDLFRPYFSAGALPAAGDPAPKLNRRRRPQ